jgi:hypothetical protein
LYWPWLKYPSAVIVRLQSAVLKALRLLNRLTDAGFLVSLRMLLQRSIRPRPMHREANPPRGARRRSKNCGGGIVPAAIGALIEAGHSSVNAFPISLRLPEALGRRQ